jgi:rubrerythrin
MKKTEQNLKEAFAGESQANRKYLAYAKKADEEGHKQVAKLFRAAAEAETIHALNHLRGLEAIKSTKDNLEDAISGETHEFENMYPQMIVEAQSDNDTRAERSFMYANAVEKIHADLYKKAVENLGKNPDVDYYVCKVCGNTVEGEPPDKCPICNSPKKMFKKVD